jgi:hypothetical protein
MGLAGVERPRRRIVAGILFLCVAAGSAIFLGGSVLGSPREGESLRAEKRALLEREDRLRAETPVRPKPKAPQAPGPAIPSDAEWPEGIFDDGEFPSADYRFVNRWTGRMRGSHVTVYAGSYAANPSRGVVLVMTVSMNLKDVHAREYPSPGVGPVRIVAVRGALLSLVAADGARLGFDVVSRTFALA